MVEIAFLRTWNFKIFPDPPTAIPPSADAFHQAPSPKNLDPRQSVDHKFSVDHKLSVDLS